jgi:hypothetical protein
MIKTSISKNLKNRKFYANFRIFCPFFYNFYPILTALDFLSKNAFFLEFSKKNPYFVFSEIIIFYKIRSEVRL